MCLACLAQGCKNPHTQTERQPSCKKQDIEPCPGYKRFIVYKNKLQKPTKHNQRKNKGSFQQQLMETTDLGPAHKGGRPSSHNTADTPLMETGDRHLCGEWIRLVQEGAVAAGCPLAAGVTAGRCHGKLPGSGSLSMSGEGHLAETSRSAGTGPGTALCSFSTRSEKR